MINVITGKFDNLEYDVRGIATSFFPGMEIAFVQEPDEIAIPEGCGGEIRLDLEEIIGDDGIPKNEMRKKIYLYLREMTGRDLPWGILIGIRPSKLARRQIERGYAGTTEDRGSSAKAHGNAPCEAKLIDEAASFLMDEYFVSEEKAKLAASIAMKEIKLMGSEKAIGDGKPVGYAPYSADGGAPEDATAEPYSLYIGIPFCPTRCLYCSFTAYPINAYASKVDTYLDALFKEIEWTASRFGKAHQPHTIYIGGGTPTSLSASDLERLLKKVAETFDLNKVSEFTVEAGRPDSITREKLEVMKKCGVSRISINPQTMNDKTLKLIGRNHSVADIIEKFELAREVGFDNINMDIILGLPGEMAEDVKTTMREIKALSPDSLTVHALAIKRASRLKMESEGVPMPGFSDEESAKMMRVAEAGAREMNLEPYYMYRQKNMAGALENVGYSVPGKEGLYNIVIIEETESIVALGAGTVSKRRFSDGSLERCDTHKDVDLYIEQIEEMIARKEKLFFGN